MNNLTKKKKALIPSLARSVSSVAVGSKKRRGATLTPTIRLNNPTTENRTRVRPLKKKTKETAIELQTLQNQMGGRARQMSMMMERGDFVPENNVHSSDESSDGSNDERTTTGGLGFNASSPATTPETPPTLEKLALEPKTILKHPMVHLIKRNNFEQSLLNASRQAYHGFHSRAVNAILNEETEFDLDSLVLLRRQI